MNKMKDNNALLVVENGRPSMNQSSSLNQGFFLDETSTFIKDAQTKKDTATHLIYHRKEDTTKNTFGFNFSRRKWPCKIYQPNISIQDSVLNMDIHDLNLNQSWISDRNLELAFYNKTHQRITFNYNSKYRHCGSFRKRDCVSFLDVETDRSPRYKYRPGETVTGRYTLIVKRAFEIKCVQLVTTGQGRLTRYVSSDDKSRTFRHTYLHDDQCLLEGDNIRYGSVLVPGLYTSQFSVKLPKDLPSSVHHKDSVNGFIFDVSYTIKVRLCAKADVVPLWHTSNHLEKSRVLLEKQIYIIVERDFDIIAVPDAMSPIVHTEQVYLTCVHQEAVTVTVNTDRSVFLAGDNIRMYLRVSLPAQLNIKNVKCCLQKHVITNPNHEPWIFSFHKIVCKDPEAADDKMPGCRRQNFVVNIPTDTKLLSPFSLGSSQIRVEYFLFVTLRFIPAGGKLSFKIPVGIGPCAEMMITDKILPRRTIPLFNKTMRFPYFSARNLPTNSSSTQPSISSNAASVAVTTKYSNGFLARCFLCCLGTVD